jgi:Tfp pilus assembly protein PilF
MEHGSATDEVEQQTRTRAGLANAVLLFTSVVVIALHVYAVFEPTALNWGFHHMAFLHPGFRLVLPLLMVLALFAQVHHPVVRYLEQSQRSFQSVPVSFLAAAYLLLAVCAGVLFWFAREQTYFMGDGALIHRNMSMLRRVDQIQIAMQNSPLPGYIGWRLIQLMGMLEWKPAVTLGFQLMSILFGVGCVLALLPLSSQLASEGADRILAYLFILTSGASQMFFGHVEAYTPTLFFLILFIWFSLSHINGRMHLAAPAIAFAFAFASHFGMLCMVPAFLMLLYRAARERRFGAVGIALAVFVLALMGVLYMCGYTPAALQGFFIKESGKQLVPLSTLTTTWQVYTFFSIWHVINLANLQVLISPFALVMFVTVLVMRFRHISLREYQTLFLLLVAISGLAYTVFINFDIGMSRDWDLAALYGISMVIATPFLWNHFIGDSKMRRRWLTIAVLITSVHTFAWMVLHTSEQRSIARFTTLQDERVWSQGALTYAYEDLAVFYRGRGEKELAAKYFLLSALHDSLNSRRWVSVADMFQSIGNEEEATAAYEKAIQLNTRIISPYVNLGFYYGRRDMVDEAIELWKKALTIDTTMSTAAYNIGTTLLNKRRDFEGALPWLQQTLRMDSTHALAYQNAGVCTYNLGRYDEMRYYWAKFLSLAPNNPDAERIRTILEATAGMQGKTRTTPRRTPGTK